ATSGISRALWTGRIAGVAACATSAGTRTGLGRHVVCSPNLRHVSAAGFPSGALDTHVLA
ncbi:MAG: hypothetical protein M3446_11830, partial [Actinomycetota bacterium]|nr:hypothetical protein [Actinomycetota bacterium]